MSDFKHPTGQAPASLAQPHHWLEAVRACPLQPNEGMFTWFERIGLKAQELAAPRLPYVEPREPGIEG